MLKGASPALAKHFEDVQHVLDSWSLTLEEFDASTIEEATVRMLRGMKRETRDFIPDAFRLAAYCDSVAEDRRKAAVEARWREEESRHQAVDPETHARNVAKLRLIWPADIGGVDA